MYRVVTIESWENHITETEYPFHDEVELLSFMLMCREDGVKFRLLRNDDKSKIAV